jgi:hypothetical protein
VPTNSNEALNGDSLEKPDYSGFFCAREKEKYSGIAALCFDPGPIAFTMKLMATRTRTTE